MLILHTADWHIGQRLHERPRIDEHRQFLEWLLKTIKERAVELLLVSGDIFNTSLPSADATNLYYDFLHRFSKETKAYAVITAGNHDSPRHLEAPKEFLKMGRIYVVGRAAEADDCVLPFPPENPKVAVAAVPYLSESELSHISFETEPEKAERYRERLKALYRQCVDAMPAELPKILMGHLFVKDGKVGDSERNIQIGGATAIHVKDFPDGVDYVALGHLHRPQEIKRASYPVRYSGSPLPLRFNEATYRKTVYLLEVSDAGKSLSVEGIEIPNCIGKELCTVEGDLNTVLTRAMEEDWDGKYIQVKLTLDKPEVGIKEKVQDAFGQRGGDVLIVKLELRDPACPDPWDGIQLEDLRQPTEIFKLFYEKKGFGKEPDEQLMQTFTELLESVKNKEVSDESDPAET